MNATVNENCIGCGLCAGNCPEVFHMGDDGFAHGSGRPGRVPGQRYQRRVSSAEYAKARVPVSGARTFFCRQVLSRRMGSRMRSRRMALPLKGIRG